jgi:hypothetical protein
VTSSLQVTKKGEAMQHVVNQLDVQSAFSKAMRPSPWKDDLGESMVQDLIKQIETNGYGHIPQLYTDEQVNKAITLANYWYKQTKDR